jgi:hypothetical protein
MVYLGRKILEFSMLDYRRNFLPKLTKIRLSYIENKEMIKSLSIYEAKERCIKTLEQPDKYGRKNVKQKDNIS